MPGANESSTVEWQRAHWMPTARGVPSAFMKAVTPTTAFARSSSTVVAGSSMFTLPALICAMTSDGRAAASTFRPRLKAAFGLRPGPTPPNFSPTIAWCSRSWSPQNASFPNVS